MLRALLILLLVAPPLRAAPALWAVHGPQATVYLLGSFHLSRPGVAWESPAIDHAFDQAQECWFEIDPSATGDLLSAGTLLFTAFDFSHRLSDRLSPRSFQRLADTIGQDPARLDHLRPWLVATMLSLRQWRQAGFTPEAGVERVLMQKARTAGKLIRGIETPQSQMRLLADMPDPVAITSIEKMLNQPEASVESMDRLATLWLDGDVDGVAAQTATMFADSDPELARRFVADRNVHFADKVAELLSGDKTVLLTVGAAHMAGPAGVPALLIRRGWTVERVE